MRWPKESVVAHGYWSRLWFELTSVFCLYWPFSVMGLINCYPFNGFYILTNVIRRTLFVKFCCGVVIGNCAIAVVDSGCVICVRLTRRCLVISLRWDINIPRWRWISWIIAWFPVSSSDVECGCDPVNGIMLFLARVLWLTECLPDIRLPLGTLAQLFGQSNLNSSVRQKLIPYRYRFNYGP